MDFSFSEDQQLFQQSARDFLRTEITPERIRESWDNASGRSDALWSQLGALGLNGILVPEAHDGLGMNEVDFVLLAEECGYVALAEPLVETVLVGVPLLRDCGNASLAAQWLPRIAAGEARIAIGLACNPLVADAHVANLLLLQHGEELHAVPPEAVQLTANPSLDPSRRLFRVDWQPVAATLVVAGATGRALLDAALNRAALGAAAQCLGLTQRLVDLSVAYTRDRQQFGQPIGSFQAVQHLLANVAVKLDYARAPVHRAACDIAHGSARAAVSVSHAKLVACEAALLAARNSIQVHGAMGYTWEVDVHIFAKRAWSLDSAWGDRAFHKQRVADFVLCDGARIGAAETF
ncbi:MAG: acyl-CoA/acyl-ACP dehydrogenase [Gammaproteobacteria bacterium]|nr:acyl-CoA/acyl-ACP dehydrogenase [Gammaproteobacteria bacterium]MBK7730903.1 acyl-CoA/acyl-ACP dehydrogenase [Gammaproteobacteria bacterium]MBK8306420.1 acyl-CoA/acyl-ACP dehydrogenase [Gammaproteobacteria bacterium]